MNFQGLRKPSFYSYQFLNRLGDTELISSDKDSWVCKSANGVQLLFWNFTAPVTNESNQKFYTKDVPAKNAGPLRVAIKGIPPGNYTQRIYRVGYQINDVYADYLRLGAPQNLTRGEVNQLAEKNDGRAVSTTKVVVSRAKPYQYEVSLLQNDVFLIVLDKK